MALTTYVVGSGDKKSNVVGYDSRSTFPPVGTWVLAGDEKYVVMDVFVEIKDGRVNNVNVILDQRNMGVK